ncbi:aspartate aminotransferase family protein [Candidatus Colwellia aromaticivorans]|uniref:aspartate aminotransferase family protein n=1 Tax=Candidatus Colwellia aromaticivorans TaxID=2267621 RepID=UPI000DF21E33|nr:aminotransferase class III-fold pyridoxal phosphate-dependent enzyme [Candidatus Colwellia aromaticivorans]
MNDKILLERRNRLIGKKAPLFYNEPLHIVKGEGVWLYDADGKRYLDAYNNVPNVGHCHPHVVEALYKQAQELNIHTRYLHENIVNYGEKLLGKLDDSLDMLFLTCTGTEANELALRMARESTGRQGIICSNATYHGNSAAVYPLATMFNQGLPLGANVKSVAFPDSYHKLNGLEGESLENAYADQVKQAIEEFNQDGTGFAGMIICPIFANEGLPDKPSGYLDKIAKYVREAGGVLIFDEVQSAFGRTGKWWGHQNSRVVPDILVLGKPMGNGHPIGATICSSELGNGFRDNSMYFNTFGGNPVSCAVGMAVLEVIENESLVENSANVGNYLKQKIWTLSEKHELIGDVRGSGLFFGVELVSDRMKKTPATIEAGKLINQMKEQGVLISRLGINDNILKMRPPICFSHAHADMLIEHLDQAFTALY